jgi:ADP-ribosylglycohydrolase
MAIEDGVWGHLVGDALGVPYEFHPREQIPPLDRIEMRPPDGFRRAHPSVEPGTWSDDGALMLCLLASLKQAGGKLDPRDLGRRFINWYEHGYLAVNSDVFDVGIQTRGAIERLREGTPALEAGAASERQNGNGSLMRTLPIALVGSRSDAEIVADARDQSKITHGHVRSQLCCAAYCLWAKHGGPFAAAVEKLRALCPDEPDEVAKIADVKEPHGSGYVLDSLHSAVWAVETAGKDYESTVRAAISLGDDTDTTACIAGGIAGLRYGAASIPRRWMEAMREKDTVTELLRRS